MTASLSTAFSLLLIGMITVFVVLALVVGLGHLLIYLTNEWSDNPPANPRDNRPTEAEVAAIVAAVDAATSGQGHVTSIVPKKH